MDSMPERFAGDDWVWSWTTTDDVSSWASPIVTISSVPAGSVVLTSIGGSPTIVTTGDPGLGVAATDFSTGIFTFFARRADTTAITPGRYLLEVEVIVAGVATTVLASTFSVHRQTAVRP